MESLAERRRQEAECELLQIEADVWTDLVREQQALVDAEQRKLGGFAEEVFNARSAFCQEAVETQKRVKGMISSLGGFERPPSSKETASQSQQTDPTPAPIRMDMRKDELQLLREEVANLEKAANLLDEQKRLANEPRLGHNFIELGEAQRLDKERILDLDRKLAELELAVLAIENTPDIENIAGPDDFGWAEAPWDRDSAADPPCTRPVPSRPAGARPCLQTESRWTTGFQRHGQASTGSSTGVLPQLRGQSTPGALFSQRAVQTVALQPGTPAVLQQRPAGLLHHDRDVRPQRPGGQQRPWARQPAANAAQAPRAQYGPRVQPFGTHAQPFGAHQGWAQHPRTETTATWGGAADGGSPLPSSSASSQPPSSTVPSTRPRFVPKKAMLSKK